MSEAIEAYWRKTDETHLDLSFDSFRRKWQMVVIQGRGTISVTEPGKDIGTYYENAEISVYGMTVHFFAYGKFKSASLDNCLIGWDGSPTVREATG
jgi:hypothetical protein